jgi:SAM-dependent methyltransferase
MNVAPIGQTNYEGTGPGLQGALVKHLRLVDSSSKAEPELTDETLDQARAIAKQSGVSTPQKLALLGVLLARLEDVPFEQVATLLNVRSHLLEEMMHGRRAIPDARIERWNDLLTVLQNLHRVLKPSATGRWLVTSIPDLGGRTPLETISRNEIVRVVKLTESYLDPSFS